MAVNGQLCCPERMDVGHWGMPVGKKSGFTPDEIKEITRLYVDEGRSITQIARVIGKGSETSVRNALKKGRIKSSTEGRKTLEPFKPGQKYGKITLVKKLQKSKKLKYHVACDCGYEFDVDPYLLTLAKDHKNLISQCQRCKSGGSHARGVVA